MSSWVWDHFDKNANIADCLHCHKTLKCSGGSTSSLIKHLNLIHKLFNVDVINYQNLSKEQYETADNLKVELISQKMLTLDIVECDAFNKFVNHLNPNYKLPNRKSRKRLSYAISFS